ncbi:MAG TPA: dihydrofolate reductase [Candidatus Paceibacterota bacterium]|nr:dihydrofolate reductase [Candidatus Paceibacterota bacterium]
MKCPNISIVVAASENNCIGKNNKIPWHIPTDLYRFKKLTDGHIVLMGRKTYESIGKPLRDRINIVASRKPYISQHFNVLIDDDVWSNIHQWRDEIFIIGGSQIYEEGFKYANTLYLTRIHAHIDGDAFLKGFNEDEWELIKEEGPLEENGFKFTFLTYKRK